METTMARISRLPNSFPVGTKYVLEGTSSAEGVFRVTGRYVVLPGGRKLNLPVTSRSGGKLPPAPSIGTKAARTGHGRSRTQRATARAAV
jgi:hypothetical protein